MLKISGKYGTATVYINEISNSIWNSIFNLVNSPMVEDSEIRIMPNVYKTDAGLVGVTINGGKGLSPGIIGKDIGCGTLCIKLKEKYIDLEELDSLIKRSVAMKRNKVPHVYANNIDLYRVRARLKKEDMLYYELGCLGCGGHFIEVCKDEKDGLYLIVHSGSGDLGIQIMKYWQGLAYKSSRGMESKGISRELSWLEGAGKDLYLEDISRAMLFARWNRAAIVDVILSGMHLHDEWSLETIHNYVVSGITRRGAISAGTGKRVLIPLTMSSGFILGTGKGAKDWNYSAPSGLGRIEYSKKKVSMPEYREVMFDVYSSSVCKKTLSECPQTYKSVDEIIPLLAETIDIEQIIKPVYNFKAC